ncbi:hypothetical protein V8G54_021476 [Vigna mungo]|uniref:Uncharacterized protein n=1 Tax=Vigna mungo TaxID=3915 RepID=A0AAQ3NDE3_VIGMU
MLSQFLSSSLFDFAFSRKGFFQVCHCIFTRQPCSLTIGGATIRNNAKQSYQSPLSTSLTTMCNPSSRQWSMKVVLVMVLRMECEKKWRKLWFVIFDDWFMSGCV